MCMHGITEDNSEAFSALQITLGYHDPPALKARLLSSARNNILRLSHAWRSRHFPVFDKEDVHDIMCPESKYSCGV